MDIVFLHELRLQTSIGVYEWERKIPQTIEMDLDIGLPHSRAGQSDDVADTIDYAAVVEHIRSALGTRHFALAEALAEHVAQVLMSDFHAPWVRVKVTKLGLINGVKRLGVIIERGRRPT